MTQEATFSHAILFGALMLAGPVSAEAPCVGDTFNSPVPGATNVVRRIVDVASAHVAGLWQEGQIAGFAYQVFSNRTGVVSDSLIEPIWRIEIFCDASEELCRQGIHGAPPEGAALIADGISLCLTGAPVDASTFFLPEAVSELTIQDKFGVAATAPAPEAPMSRASAPDDLPTTVAPAWPACELAATEGELQLVAQLQALLAQIGFDPGPIDGLLGPLTLAAYEEATREPVDQFDAREAMSLLREMHCSP